MNKVILIGNLTKDVELTTTNSGLSVDKFTLAVQRKFENADGERAADFINCVAWRGLADNVAKYIAKGSKCCVVGVLQTRSYENQDGERKYITEVVANEVEFVGTKKKESEKEPAKKEKKSEKVEFEPIDDDDLPF